MPSRKPQRIQTAIEPVPDLPRAFIASSFSFFSTTSFRTHSDRLMTTPAAIPPRMTRPQLMGFMRLLLSEAAGRYESIGESACPEHRPGGPGGSRGNGGRHTPRVAAD